MLIVSHPLYKLNINTHKTLLISLLGQILSNQYITTKTINLQFHVLQELKIIKILKSMDASELRAFQQYLKVLSKGKASTVMRLFSMLRAYHPDFKNRGLNKERIFVRLFPEEAYQARKLWDRISELTGKLEEFLVIKEVQNRPYLKEKLLAQAYSNRQLFDLFAQKTKQLIHKIENKNQRGIDHYLELHDHWHQLFFHPEIPKFNNDPSQLLPLMVKNLDQFYALAKLRYSSELITRKKTLSQKYDIKLLDEIWDLTQNHFQSEHPIFSIFFYINRLFAEGHDEHRFKQVKNQYLQYSHQIAPKDQQTILIFLLNHATSLVNKGDYQYNKDILELYKVGLKEKLLIEKGIMVDAIFTNIAIAGSFMKDFAWTKEFIDNYSPYLDDNQKDNARKLSLGYWHFHKSYWENNEEDFEKTIDLLGTIDYNQLAFGLRAKSLLLRTYYEYYLRGKANDNYQFIIDFTTAFKKYVKRNTTLSPARTNEYLNFISLVKKMLTFKYRIFHEQDKVNKKTLKALHQELLEMKHSITRFWLNEKLEELAQLLQ